LPTKHQITLREVQFSHRVPPVNDSAKQGCTRLLLYQYQIYTEEFTLWGLLKNLGIVIARSQGG
ncbi:MAG: hypothetical protein NT028_09240, partial [candidate division Zixibacteria bacterium]|nr:hypothetical protein [candidate division Zixibacteria bacterium]